LTLFDRKITVLHYLGRDNSIHIRFLLLINNKYLNAFLNKKLRLHCTINFKLITKSYYCTIWEWDYGLIVWFFGPNLNIVFIISVQLVYSTI
jgi:hypothetical protein